MQGAPCWAWVTTLPVVPSFCFVSPSFYLHARPSPGFQSEAYSSKELWALIRLAWKCQKSTSHWSQSSVLAEPCCYWLLLPQVPLMASLKWCTTAHMPAKTINAESKRNTFQLHLCYFWSCNLNRNVCPVTYLRKYTDSCVCLVISYWFSICAIEWSVALASAHTRTHRGEDCGPLPFHFWGH